MMLAARRRPAALMFSTIGVAGHVGLGSDFDGAWMPKGLEDVPKLPRISEALLRRGYSDQDVKQILGGNLLRGMEQLERASGAPGNSR